MEDHSSYKYFDCDYQHFSMLYRIIKSYIYTTFRSPHIKLSPHISQTNGNYKKKI